MAISVLHAATPGPGQVRREPKKEVAAGRRGRMSNLADEFFRPQPMLSVSLKRIE